MTTVLDEPQLTALVTSITGPSAIGAVTILADTGDPRRFATAGALVKRAGVAPRQKLSGTLHRSLHSAVRDRVLWRVAQAQRVRPGPGKHQAQLERTDAGEAEHGMGATPSRLASGLRSFPKRQLVPTAPVAVVPMRPPTVKCHVAMIGKLSQNPCSGVTGVG